MFAAALVASNRPRRQSWLGAEVSLAVHTVTLAALIFVPIFWPSPPPEQPDMIRALLYDPPPPPPPPLPMGSGLVPRTEPAKPVTPDPEVKVEAPKFQAPIEVPQPVEKPLTPEEKAPAEEQFGSDRGSEFGLADGMEGGVEGGQVGGVPGGVLGGVVGGTGTGPVMDYDQPPRLIKQSRPLYPQEAFIKKIEGTVVLEILIDATGRVIRARVIQSVPLLDAAAVKSVSDWVFTPATKHGRPVATLAHVPVSFRIF
ncbi:MAG TPA: TonB family protein [Vicinamibacteria bacterium]|nr:TonB family protein [Vicinamibacteria bacterium]